MNIGNHLKLLNLRFDVSLLLGGDCKKYMGWNESSVFNGKYMITEGIINNVQFIKDFILVNDNWHSKKWKIVNS